MKKRKKTFYELYKCGFCNKVLDRRSIGALCEKCFEERINAPNT